MDHGRLFNEDKVKTVHIIWQPRSPRIERKEPGNEVDYLGYTFYKLLFLQTSFISHNENILVLGSWHTKFCRVFLYSLSNESMNRHNFQKINGLAVANYS